MKKLKILISFDDTGSMSSIRYKVRREAEKIAKFFFSLNFDVSISAIIHNDYCDRDTIQLMNFTNTESDIIRFLNSSSSCGGGDHAECYGLVLKTANDLHWSDADEKILILIGDAPPHERGDKTSKYGQSGYYIESIDWREEVRKLSEKSIRIFSIQALGRSSSNYFYEGMANMSNGIKLDLSQIEDIVTFIQGILHSENGTLDEFQAKLTKRSNSLQKMFSRLRGEESSPISVTSYGERDTIGKFQQIEVLEDIRIDEFVRSMGLPFATGKGYYEFTKSEKIQANKEILLVDKKTGETLTDTDECRKLMGLNPIQRGVSGNHTTMSPRNIECAKDYKIFIQSNSHTRKLIGGTTFLYEMEYR